MEDNMSDLETYLRLQGWILGIGIFLAFVYLAVYIGITLLHRYERETERAAKLRERQASLTPFERLPA